MSKKEYKLKYQNEDDRCYGLAGMAISLAALDALDRVVSVSVDAEGPMVSFDYSYYFSGSPAVSPKATWNNIVENYQLTSAMAISNVLSRYMVKEKKEFRQDYMDRLYEEIAFEGRETCALEDDEIRSLFDKTLSYSRRIFNNRRLYPMIDEFARVIARKRVLTGKEIQEILRQLDLI